MGRRLGLGVSLLRYSKLRPNRYGAIEADVWVGTHEHLKQHFPRLFQQAES